MIEFLKTLKHTFALSTICTIFNDDAHGIVSKRGREILRNGKYK